MKTSVDLGVISRDQIKAYAEASGDFNRIHLDDSFAKQAGLTSVIAHGMLSMGLAARALQEAGVSSEQLKSLESKFKDKVFPGDRLRAELDLEAKELRLLNQNDIEILSASFMS